MRRKAYAARSLETSYPIIYTSRSIGILTTFELETRHQYLHIVFESSGFVAGRSVVRDMIEIVREESSLHQPGVSMENQTLTFVYKEKTGAFKSDSQFLVDIQKGD